MWVLKSFDEGIEDFQTSERVRLMLELGRLFFIKDVSHL